MLDLSGVLAPKEGRDIEVITREILDAKRRGGEAILTIGRCLTEAKQALPHGEWLPWLNERVELSERAAQRFMRLSREWSNPTALSDLGATKALALLALPADERDQFIETHNVVEKYKALGDYNRLRELKQADDEGRCVVPPCKVGQKVKVDVRTWGNVWNYKTVENGKFLIGEIVAITKTKKQTLVKIRVEHNVSWKRPTRRYPASAIGKTVFLTREEAALRREQDEKGGGSE